MALRALAKAMTGAIHFVPWSKPANVGQFWFFHAPSFPQSEADYHACGFQTAPLPEITAIVAESENRSSIFAIDGGDQHLREV
jgi:hypothetical protein